MSKNCRIIANFENFTNFELFKLPCFVVKNDTLPDMFSENADVANSHAPPGGVV